MTDAPHTGATPEIAGGILLATLPLSFTSMTKSSAAIPQAQQQQIFDALENDAQVVSNSQIQHLAAHQSPAVQAEVVQININANHVSLQVALLVPLLASLIGLFNAFRMMRLPEIKPAANLEAASLG